MTATIRRRPSSTAAPPLEDDDLLSEILLRLPPLPSSLPRAAAVSRRWRSLASDPRFSGRFRSHHRRSPPLLGCFVGDAENVRFQPILEPPNRVPHARFSFPIDAGDRVRILGFHHGLMLIFHETRNQLLVWEPVTGDQHRLDIPPGFDTLHRINGAVLRAVGDVHHFQVVLLGNSDLQHTQMAASIYSSKIGIWGNLITSPLSGMQTWVYTGMPAVMVGDSLYWLVVGNSFGILEFDLHRRSLALIPMPQEDTLPGGMDIWNMWIIIAKDGGLGFVLLSKFNAQLWKRKTNGDGVDSWVLGSSIQLDKLLNLNPEDENYPLILGFAENNNIVLLQTSMVSSQSSLNHCSPRKLWNLMAGVTSIHSKVSILQTRALVDTVKLNFCKIHNLNCPDSKTCYHDVLAEQVSRVGFRWLRCRYGLLAVGSSILYAVASCKISVSNDKSFFVSVLNLYFKKIPLHHDTFMS